MNAAPKAAGRLVLSVVLSVAVSVALTVGLRMLITATMQQSKDGGDEEPGPPLHRRGAPRGANINPVSIFVFMPILVGNRSNAFGPSRSLVWRVKRKR